MNCDSCNITSIHLQYPKDKIVSVERVTRRTFEGELRVATCNERN